MRKYRFGDKVNFRGINAIVWETTGLEEDMTYRIIFAWGKTDVRDENELKEGWREIEVLPSDYLTKEFKEVSNNMQERK